MKTVLKDYHCYVDLSGVVGDVKVKVYGKTECWPRPRLFILEGTIASGHDLSIRVNAKALLDTGNDITIVKLEKVKELEACLPFKIPVMGRIEYCGDRGPMMQPAYELAFIFPGDHHSYSSMYGFIALSPLDWEFDVADMWLGQDIFSQLEVTFDGVNETVTIIDPKDP